MKRALISAAIPLALSSTAFAQEAPKDAAAKLPAIDFAQTIKNPRGVAFDMCESAKPECGKTWDLGWAAYLALNAPSAPRQPGASPSPDEVKNAALGARIYGSTAPYDLDAAQRDDLKKAMFRVLPAAIAYSACVLIKPPEGCDR